MSSGEESDSDDAPDPWANEVTTPLLTPSALAPPRPHTGRTTRKRENARRRRALYRDADGAPLMQPDGHGSLEVVGSEFSVPYSAVDSTVKMLAKGYRKPPADTLTDDVSDSDGDETYSAPSAADWPLDIAALLPRQAGALTPAQLTETCTAAEGALALQRALGDAADAHGDLLHSLQFLRDGLSEVIETCQVSDETLIGRILLVIDGINGLNEI